MKKRNKIIMIIGLILLIVVTTFVLLDGTFLKKKYASVWSEGYIDQLENDQERMIAFGIRSASSHNSQPWLVKIIDQNTIELYADTRKSLPVVDGDHKQLLMSQGTFIEGYIAGANHYGYKAEITYAIADFDQKKPLIATIRVQKELSSVTSDAVTSSTYDAMTMDKDSNLKDKLDQVFTDYPGFSYLIVDSNQEVEKLEGLLLEGTVIESQDEAATKELLNVFRFTEWQKNQFRNGLSLSTLPAIIKPFIQPIMNFSSDDWKSFGEGSIKQFKQQLDKQDKYILIRHDASSDKDYVLAGQLYQKLIFEIGNYNLRPAMQVLENFEAMQKLNRDFQQAYGYSEEVVMILAVQSKTNTSMVSNPRHLVDDILLK